jgi:integrase
MSVFKRTIKTKQGKSQYWYIDYTLNGKRKWESVGRVGEATKADARTLLALRRTEILQGKFKAPDRRAVPTFAEFAMEYLEYAKGNKKSWDRDACSLRRLVPFFGTYTLNDISPILIERYKLERKKSVSARTVNIELSLLRRMFNLGIAWDKCQSNPVTKVKFYKEEPSKTRVLSEDEEYRLLASSSDHLKPILVTALNTGMRYSEILSLCWKEVYLEAGYINVAQSKSGKSRQIPINNRLEKALRRLKLGSSVSNSVSSEYLSTQNSKEYQSVKYEGTVACQARGREFKSRRLRHPTIQCLELVMGTTWFSSGLPISGLASSLA